MNRNLIYLFGNPGGMLMCKLSPSIEIDTIETEDELIDACYIKFKESILNKENRPTLFGREVFVPVGDWINYKAQIFWHVSSLSLDDRITITILPCNNDVAMNKCDENCIYHKSQIKFPNGGIRDMCYYRSTKAFWVKEIIQLANDKDGKIKSWIKRDVKKKRNELYLRYQNQNIDYISIFEDKPNGKYVFITAYPVFYVNSKDGFNKDYQSYLKSIGSEN